MDPQAKSKEKKKYIAMKSSHTNHYSSVFGKKSMIFLPKMVGSFSTVGATHEYGWIWCEWSGVLIDIKPWILCETSVKNEISVSCKDGGVFIFLSTCM